MLTPSDIQRIDAEFQAAHGSTDLAASGSLPDIEAHLSAIETAMGGIDSAITFYDAAVRENQNQRDAYKDKKRALERDFDRLKRVYWNLRDEAKRSSVPH